MSYKIQTMPYSGLTRSLPALLGRPWKKIRLSPYNFERNITEIYQYYLNTDWELKVRRTEGRFKGINNFI